MSAYARLRMATEYMVRAAILGCACGWAGACAAPGSLGSDSAEQASAQASAQPGPKTSTSPAARPSGVSVPAPARSTPAARAGHRSDNATPEAAAHQPTAPAVASDTSGRADGTGGPEAATPAPATAAPAVVADVLSVRASGAPGAYRFAVRVQSPDTGCRRYANYWEVLTPEGELLYRRILAHAHVDEQPFTRSGGPVPVAADAVVVVRAHMHPGGHGGTVMRGSASAGFTPFELPAGFAAEAADRPPQPRGCAY